MNYCNFGCCKIHSRDIESVQIRDESYYNNKVQTVKSGVICYDSKSNKVLLIQSVSMLWGPPKGSCENKESLEDCALREFHEETGLHLSPLHLKKFINVGKKARYYFVERPECPISIPSSDAYNDVTGITWIKLTCLQDLVRANKLKVTFHCRYIFERLFGILL